MGAKNNKNIYEVNTNKLEKYFQKIHEETGKTDRDIAEEIGYDRGYFGNVFAKGKMHNIAVKFLEKEYGITLADITGEDEPEAIEVVGADISECLNGIEALHGKLDDIAVKIENIPKMTIRNGQDSAASLTKEELANVIYKAVYSAVKHAWEEPEEKQ